MRVFHDPLYELLDVINGFDLQQNLGGGQRNADPALTLDCLVNDPNYSLQEIAHILGYSYRHTARKIKEIYGDSLTNVRREIMLTSAKTLLIRESELSLEQIARQSGFTGAYVSEILAFLAYDVTRDFRKHKNLIHLEASA